MARFIYTAKSLDGEIKSGTSNAKDLKELARNLRSKGLFLTTAEDKYQKRKKIFNIILFSRKVSIGEKIFMARNLSIMVSTGLPLVKGFSILSAQSKSKRMKTALSEIGQEISKGKNLSDSFKKYPDIFSELFQSMIQSGEESGTLEEVLNTLSLQLEKEKELKSKIQRALIYPFILISLMIIIGIGLASFILPKINTFFKSLNVDLPLTTKIILGAGDFFTEYWQFVLLIFSILIFILIVLLKTKKGRVIIDTILLKTPLISPFIKKSNSALLIRSLSSLLASGIHLIRSLEITSGTVNNFYFKKALLGVTKEVEKGEKLFTSFKNYQDLFPYGTVDMIEIGEETGKTSMILKKLAEFYEEEVSDIAENLSTIIEPILIIIIGLVVGIFAISIIGPMYSSLSSI